MSSPRITYAARQDATPEGELNALAAVYLFVLARTKAAERAPEPDGRDDHGSLKRAEEADVT
jgi:hypothetical protein